MGFFKALFLHIGKGIENRISKPSNSVGRRELGLSLLRLDIPDFPSIFHAKTDPIPALIKQVYTTYV